MSQEEDRKLVWSAKDKLSFAEVSALQEDGHCCIECNGQHRGSVGSAGHAHRGVEGVGFVRLLVIGLRPGIPQDYSRPEHCWRCGCVKSGAVNAKNNVWPYCTDNDCVCHTAERTY